MYIVALAMCLVFALARVALVACSDVALFMKLDLPLAGASTISIGFGLFYLLVKPDLKLAGPCFAVGLSLLCLVAACEVGDLPFYFGRGYPLQDAFLAGIDKALGFCWPCYVRWFDAHDVLHRAGFVVYESILAQSFLICLMLVWTHQVRRLCVYFAAYNLAFLLTNIVAYRFPALGVYAFYRLSPADHAHISMAFMDQMTDPIMLLRSGTFTSSFVDQQILISFPSFHGVLASLFVWGAWRSAWRWFFVLVNGVMLLVTPVQGSHYATDIAAGLLIGLVSIRCAHAFVSLGLQIASTPWAHSGSIARTSEAV